MAKKEFARNCTACSAGMNEGYCINDGEAYYCGDACLGDYCTQEEWAELYADGEGDSYWTAWEDPDDFEGDDEISEVERLRAALREAVEIIEGTGLDASVQRAALRQEV